MKHTKLEIENGTVRLNGKVQEDVTSISITIEALSILTCNGEMVADVEVVDGNGEAETFPMLVNSITVDFPEKGAE